MLKDPSVQIFWAIRATSGNWQRIVIFTWWHVHFILRGSTYYNIYGRRDFRQQLPVPNREINYRILFKYARIYIAWKLFRNNVTIKENKIQNFFIEFNNGAWIENHLRVSSSKNSNMLSDAAGCPNCSKNLRRGVFQHAESKFAIRFALWPLHEYKLSVMFIGLVDME